jgi:hypothetical protein
MGDPRSDWKQKMQERAKEKASGKSFKLPEGDTTFRVLPNANGMDKSPLYEFMVHREVGPKGRLVRCGKSLTGKGRCWLCDVMIPKLRDSGNSIKRKKAEEMVAKENMAAQVAVMNTKTGKLSGPLLFYVPTGGANAFGTKLMTLLARDGRSYEHPKKGKNLTVNRTGTGMKDTRYGPIEMDDEPSVVPSEIIEKLKPFNELVSAYDEEFMKNTFFGKETARDDSRGKASRDDDDDDDDRPKRGKRSRDDDDDDDGDPDDDDDRPKRGKRRDDDDGDDDDDDKPKRGKRRDDDDDDDDDDDRPKRGKRSRHDDDDDDDDGGGGDDDDDDNGDDDDDDDDRPKRGKRSRDDDDDDDDGDPDDDDGDGDGDPDDDDDDPPKKPGKPGKSGKAPAKKAEPPKKPGKASAPPKGGKPPGKSGKAATKKTGKK